MNKHSVWLGLLMSAAVIHAAGAQYKTFTPDTPAVEVDLGALDSLPSKPLPSGQYDNTTHESAPPAPVIEAPVDLQPPLPVVQSAPPTAAMSAPLPPAPPVSAAPMTPAKRLIKPDVAGAESNMVPPPPPAIMSAPPTITAPPAAVGMKPVYSNDSKPAVKKTEPKKSPPPVKKAPAPHKKPAPAPKPAEAEQDQGTATAPDIQGHEMPHEDVTEEIKKQPVAPVSEPEAPAATDLPPPPSDIKQPPAAQEPEKIDSSIPADKTAPEKEKVERLDDLTIPAEETAAAVPSSDDLSIGFDGNSSDLSSDAQAKLKKIIGHLRSDDAPRLEVKAYATGEDGAKSSARRISLSRALAVRSFLMDNGIKPTRVDVRALGADTDRSPIDRVDLVFSR